MRDRSDPMTAPVFERTKRRGEERRTARCITKLAGTSFTAYTWPIETTMPRPTLSQEISRSASNRSVSS